MENLVIPRKLWLRGEGSAASYLLRADGKMCCLGLYLRAQGLLPIEILGVRNPSSLQAIPSWLLNKESKHIEVLNSFAAEQLMQVNDNPNLDIAPMAREAAISALFHKQGIEVSFIEEELEEPCIVS